MSNPAHATASLWRRLAAMVYDGLLLFAIIILVGLTTLPFTHFLGISRDHIVFKIYLLGVIFVFFGWFWTHGGQTLGMRAWRLRIIQRDGKSLSWTLALFRYLISLPMWGWMFYVIAVNSQLLHRPAALSDVPAWMLYSLALVWLVIDHLPNNWRDRLGGVTIIHLNQATPAA